MARSLKILVVDDMSFMREALSQILKDEGHEVVADAGDGYEAIGKFKEHRPDVVMMDIRMPKRLGVDPIQAIKKILEIDSTARIMACSAVGQEPFVQEAYQAGVRDFIVKPYDHESVRKTLRWVIQYSKPTF